MSGNAKSTRMLDSSAFVGKHLFYTYDNGWRYEMYIKEVSTIDYRIYSGMVGGRWVRDQAMRMVCLSPDIVKISWDEPTGTSVSVAINFAERRYYGVIFFPRWIVDNPEKTVCFQNDYLTEMRAYRDAGPTYPRLVVDEFAEITFVEDCGPGNEQVIACAPSELPQGYGSRRN